jgi:dTDP-4-amino-4,6-dideoxygalactose transaminase
MVLASTDRGQLALLGGTPAITLDQRAATRWPVIDEEAIAAVAALLSKGQTSMAPVVEALEAEFAAYHGRRFALTTNNGTAALHCACFALGLGPGDEVIVPADTHYSTATSVLHVGAVPIFADLHPATMTLDPVDVERRITSRTKAITVMHSGGMPCDMDGIMDVARRHHLRVIEDASHAHGATYRGRKVGSFGDIAAFSLQSSKLCPAGEGGIVITDDADLWQRATALGHYERLGGQLTYATGAEPAVAQDHRYRRFQDTAFGFKYRISPLHAAIARVSLQKLDERNRLRNANMDRLLHALADVPGLTPPRVPDHIQRVYWESPRIDYDPAELGGLPIERFVAALQAEGARVRGGPGAQTRRALHLVPLFTERAHWALQHPANAETLARDPYRRGTLPVTENPPPSRLRVPIFPHPAADLLDQYVAAFHKAAAGASQLLAVLPS